MVEPKISKNFKLKESTNLLLEYLSKRYDKTQTQLVEMAIREIAQITLNKKEVSPTDIQELEETLEQETKINKETIIQIKEEITKKRTTIDQWVFAGYERGMPVYRCPKHKITFYATKNCPRCDTRIEKDLEAYK